MPKPPILYSQNCRRNKDVKRNKNNVQRNKNIDTITKMPKQNKDVIRDKKHSCDNKNADTESVLSTEKLCITILLVFLKGKDIE